MSESKLIAEGEGGGMEVEVVHLGLQAGDMGFAGFDADEVLQVETDRLFIPEIERQRHDEVSRGERVDVVGAAARRREEYLAGAYAETSRGLEEETFSEVESVAEGKMKEVVLFFDQLVISCSTAAVYVDMHPD